ncbi:hypothetical protein HZF08_11305 [Paenibacillus sp. CGMCC 1.16610]|uniref:Cyclic-phosphate processing Receiver domain-containing protein n=1 Tax=Paenibacillus anseongense TaxID=2682845 RepID=A0ABW9U7P9_9BACL|nr:MULTISPECIES: cyclic-phosphate processing receiver domain-containing protein [Paenibacillus]MBA2938896.1 hypothetical protein [Paenibacillus sp. CGMCC 1.16610]MVQ34858.1 hypothetical protein [Paenibacillus anseongense]
MKVNIYLDDLRDCPEGFLVARTFEEAIQYFKLYTVELLSLDHDLGEDENGNELRNGYDFVKYFCENGLSASKIYLHTDNPVGRKNMYETLLAAQRRGFIDEDIEIYHYALTVNKYSGE